MARKFHITLFGAAVLCAVNFCGYAQAENIYDRGDQDIIIDAAQPKHDAKIEAAAIEKAAEKIGDLRGSLDGDMIGKIISEDDLKQQRSSRLGFPILLEPTSTDRVAANSVPIV